MAGKGLSQWRKIAMATWSRPRDPSVRAEIEVDATAALEYIAKVRAATGAKVTMTHLVGRAIGLALAEVPEVNGRVVLWSYVPSPTIDASFVVSHRAQVDHDTPGDAATVDLSTSVVRSVDAKPPWEIANELAEGTSRIRGGDDSFAVAKKVMDALPAIVLKPILELTTFVTEELGLPIPPLGLEARPFGSVMISNVGMWGMQAGFSPAPPVSRGLGGIVVGAVRDTPVAIDGEVVVRPLLPICVTIDHRLLDGYQGAILLTKFRSYLGDPASLDPVPSG